MFVYTSAKKAYAEKLLDILDPQRKLFRYVDHKSPLMFHHHSAGCVQGLGPYATISVGFSGHLS